MEKDINYFFVNHDNNADSTAFQNTVTISKEDFKEKAMSVSKRILKDMEDEAKKKGDELSPMLFMSEMLTHVVLLGALTKELFGEEE